MINLKKTSVGCIDPVTLKIIVSHLIPQNRLIFILDLKIILASNVGKKEIFHSVNCSDQPEIPQAIESHGVKPECSF